MLREQAPQVLPSSRKQSLLAGGGRARRRSITIMIKTLLGSTKLYLAPRSERGCSTPRSKPPRSSPLGTRGSAPAV